VNSEALISLRGVAVGYGRHTVLEKVDLAIKRNASVGLLGANGSGKSTLLKTVAGILPPIAGRVVMSPPETVIGYVPQREGLDSPFMLSSLEVARMGLCGRVRPGSPIAKAEHEFLDECLRRTGAADLARRPFALLSGGQKQRVLIARALAARPDILLLDEPTAGIDPAATEAIAKLLVSLHRDGMTLLMVNHDLRVVRETTDTILWVRRGKVEQGETARMLAGEPLERMSLELE
jgi:ABC-type Mn2+/Zn2+ transport system ATPase subunit